MVTLTIPAENRRALLRSFWLTLALLAAGSSLMLAWLSGAGAFASLGLGAAVIAGSIPFLNEGVAWRLYRAWNRRLVRPLSDAAARFVMAICFFVVVVAAGRAGRPMAPNGRKAGWTARGSLPIGAYRELFAAASPASRSRGWARDYVRWARQTGNLWAVSLLPFLAVLGILAGERQNAAPANIYTLF